MSDDVKEIRLKWVLEAICDTCRWYTHDKHYKSLDEIIRSAIFNRMCPKCKHMILLKQIYPY